MLKNLHLAIITALTFLVITSTNCSAGSADFTIINKTDFHFTQIIISPSEEEKWSEGLLGDNEFLYPDETYTVEINGERTGWDVAITDDEGETLEWLKLDLTDITEMLVHSNGHADLQ